MTDIQIWVIIGMSSVFVVAVVVLLWTRGGTIGLGTTKTGHVGIYIPEKWRKAHPDLDAALDCMVFELPAIRKVKRDLYLRELEEVGVPPHAVRAHEDYMFYDQCLGNIIYSGNGIRSFKSVLEMEIMHGSYRHRRRDSELEAYVEALVERLQIESDSYLDKSYRSQVTTDDGRQRLRKISRERLAELETESKRDMQLVLKRMFASMREHGCKEE